MGEANRKRLTGYVPQAGKKEKLKKDVPPRAKRKVIASGDGITIYDDGTYDGYISAVDIFRARNRTHPE